ncbi:MAG: hypothetical protein ACRDHM_07000 [Actinomycetota bacterium]
MTTPAPPAAPAATRNPATMLLGLVAAALMIVGGVLLDWLSGVPTKGLDNGIAIYWSTDVEGEASFFASAGFVILVIGAITLIGAAMARGGWVLLGGALAVLAFVLVTINIYRFEGADLGIGDLGLGLWAILVGGVVAIAAGVMGRRSTS